MKTETIAVPKAVTTYKTSKRCPDYDADCSEVKDPLACWRGGRQTINGVTYTCDKSSGYCPLIANPQ